MNILLVNDDGFDSKGIKLLAEKLSKNHNVYTIAPDSNRSAVSHHITMFNETGIKKIGEKEYTCAGYPADCVSIGILSDLFDFKFDVVISGINMGGNLGTDIVYSGTCAGARQAIINGVPGIALSIEPDDWNEIQKDGFKFDALADFACKNLETLISLCSTATPRKFVNVNGGSLDKYKGVKISDKLCVRQYNDSLKIFETEGKTFSRFVPGFGNSSKIVDNYDYDIVHDGYIAVSVVYAEPLCDDSIKDADLVL